MESSHGSTPASHIPAIAGQDGKFLYNDGAKFLWGNASSVNNPTAIVVAGGGIPYGKQIFCNRNSIPNNAQNYSNRNDLASKTRRICQVGPSAVSGIVALVPGFIMTTSGDALLGNDFNWEGALELTSPAFNSPFYMRGVKTPTIIDGVPYYQSDAVNALELAANSTFYYRQRFAVENSGGFVPISTGGSASGVDGGKFTPSTASDTFLTGALVADSGSADAGQNNGVLAATPVTPFPSVVFVSDSIGDGSGDTGSTAAGGQGFVQRGLEGVNGSIIPSLKQSIGGWTNANAQINYIPHLRAFWSLTTAILFTMNTNDIVSGGANLATLQANTLALAAEAKKIISPYGKPLQTCFSTIPPRTTSSNLFIDAIGQTIVANMGVGQTADLYNIWLLTQQGVGNIDKVINVHTPVEDPAAPRKWLSNGTNNYCGIDGTHPSTIFHQLMAVPVNTWAATLTP